MALSNAEVTQDVFKMIKQTSTLSSPQNKEKSSYKHMPRNERFSV